MFPELSDLTQYLFGFSLPIPIQTFTFFVALAYVAAYQVYKAEFKRKEKEGLIHAFTYKGEFMHPYEILDIVVLWGTLWGLIGAKLFACFEDIHAFMDHPMAYMLSANGFAYYGAFLFGAFTYFYIGYKRGIKLIHMADIGALGMLVSYAVGRIGCHLAGDGDWGIVNTYPKPNWLSWLPDWAWSNNFAHNSADVGVDIPGCVGEHCSVLPHGVFPTSLYEAVFILIVFGILWAVRRKIKIRGVMSFLYFVITGPERFFIEFIRVNPKYHFEGFSLSEAQILALYFTIVGISGFEIIWLNRRNMRAETEAQLQAKTKE